MPADEHPLGGDIGLTAEALFHQLKLPMKPQSAGAADEVMNRLMVESLRWGGIHFLRDHSARHRRDHILAITLDQVIVIEARRARGTLALVEHGTPADPDTRLELDGRDHSLVIDVLLERIPPVSAAVGRALNDRQAAPRVSGALCVLDAELKTHHVARQIGAVALHSLDSMVRALGGIASEPVDAVDPDHVDPLDRFTTNLARRLL